MVKRLVQREKCVSWATNPAYLFDGGGLLLNNELEKIFDNAFCDVTRKLTKLELQKICNEEEEDEKSLIDGCCEVIETHGYMNARIVCWFSEELFHYIINMMNMGEPPSEEETPLFLNEYINIACGYAVSKVNNLIGHSSRLSVPSFCKGVFGEENVFQGGIWLAYRTPMGKLHIFISYSFKGEQEEVV